VLKSLGMKQNLQIAIDGPVAAGKGTVARLVAERLGITYIDTGAMYRVAALLSTRAGVSWVEENRVAELVKVAEIELKHPEGEKKDGRLITVIVDGEDVSWKIRTEEMSRGSSAVAKLPLVRQALVKKQQEIAAKQGVVMEGRDITFRVLPEADLKIYLTASVEERAKRRHQELLMRGEDVVYELVLNDLKKRDEQDMGREVDPLHIVDGAWVLDTTGMTIEDVVKAIEAKVSQL
jgi:CMP/dCMP kinase